ncbi:MAG: hypothetical protein WD810_07135 [Solirubrobacterales bacterium]
MHATDSTVVRGATARSAAIRDGVAGNSRITGGAAAMLLVLLALEGATVPFVGSLLGPHIFIGMLLVPPVALKLASAGYRLARYYTGDPAYVRKGPPALPLRLLGPLVVATSLALFATGVALLVAGPPSDTLRFLHKASFIAWFAVMTVHVLGHILELPALAAPDWRRHGGREAALAGSGLRVALLLGSLAAGLALALATISAAGAWLSASLGG